MTNISIEIAEKDYGITCLHEKMENNEIRFRLNSKDGNAYIKTIAGNKGSWQKSHSHQFIKETYIVQKGWMAFASLINEKLKITIHYPGDIITSEPFVVHNIYLSANSVIHTVKHGSIEKKDWLGNQKFDKIIKDLTEENIIKFTTKSINTENIIDQRFDSYVNIYNNLDNLLWKIPSFFIGGAAILIGFIANIASKANASLPYELWTTMFFLVGILFLLGSYSMSRIRSNHTRMGKELGSLEPMGYFHAREQQVTKLWPPAAPHVFMVVFTILGFALLVLGIIAILDFEILKPFLT